MRSIYGEDGGKRHRHTHAGTCGDSLPWLLSAQMLSWGGAVNQRPCVCACRRLTVIWGLFSDDSCWHNAPFSLFIYTVQPISSLFLTPLPLFSLNSSPPSSTLSPVSWYFASRWIVMRRTPVVLVFEQQTNVARPARNTRGAPTPHYFPQAIKRKAS